MTSMRWFAWMLGLWITTVSAAPTARAQPAAEARDMEQLSQFNLGGNGDGGEGLALQQRTDGRRILYLAHEGQKTCLSVVDVTNPGAADFKPTHASDDQFYQVVDVRNPRAPREVGRWWLPGTRTGDACLPGCLPKRQKIDDGYRAHSIEIYPQRPDRAYVGYIDGGMLILDLSKLADVRAGKAAKFSPRVVSRLDYGPPYPSWCHTVQPLWRRGLAVVSDEAVQDGCSDAPRWPARRRRSPRSATSSRPRRPATPARRSRSTT